MKKHEIFAIGVWLGFFLILLTIVMYVTGCDSGWIVGGHEL